MINRPTTKEHGYLEPPIHQPGPSFGLPKRTSSVFGRRASVSFGSSWFLEPLSFDTNALYLSTEPRENSLPPSPSGPWISKQQTLSPPLPVASILSSMYANSTIAGRVGTHPTWKSNESSVRLNGHIDGSIAIISPARNSVDPDSKKNIANEQSIHPNSRTHSSFDSPMETDPRGMRSGESFASGSSGSSKGKKNSAKGPQESGSTIRVVGRGGQGSKLRVAGPQTEVIPPVIKVRSEHPPPLIRPSGRGGFASRPKPLAAPTVPPKDIIKSVDPEKPVFIRPSGRGGLASRPKPLGSTPPPTLFKLLSKSKINKGKKKSPEPTRAVHPLPPGHTYQISNGSTTTLSTLHFVDETGTPSTPFFPDDRSITSSCGDEGRSVTSDPLSGSSMYSSDHSSSKTTILSDNTAETTEEYCDENIPPTAAPVDHRQRNLNKLTRTLGSYPDDAIFSIQRPALREGTRAPQHQSQAKKDTDRNAKVFRRASISMTSLTSMFGKSGGARGGRDSVATSMLTDELHHFGLEDDLSDSWGTTCANSICEPCGSPIMFSPPSPAQERANPVHGRGLGLGLGSDEGNSESLYGDSAADALSVASSSLSYVSSQPPGTRARARAFSHSHNQSSSSSTASMLSDIHPESNKSIWLIPVRDIDDMDIRPQRKDSLDHRVSESDKPQHWSGEWNDDIHQVIKSLRLL